MRTHLLKGVLKKLCRRPPRSLKNTLRTQLEGAPKRVLERLLRRPPKNPTHTQVEVLENTSSKNPQITLQEASQEPQIQVEDTA